MSQSTIPSWGRAWKLTVKRPAGSGLVATDVVSQNAWDPEALRMTFDIVEGVLPSKMWTAEISIYNATDPTIQDYLFNAVWVTLEAGYQDGSAKSSIIWDGPVIQTLFDRENVVDFKITFNCVATVELLNNSFINFGAGKFSSQEQIISKMVSEIGGTFDVQYGPKLKGKMAAKQYPRGKTLFGRLNRYLEDVAKDNFGMNWTDGQKAYISELTAGDNVTPAIIYGPPLPPGYVASGNQSISRTVMGVPRQFAYGVIFTTLLDPRLLVQAPPMLIHLDRTVITQIAVQIPNVVTAMDPHLDFVVAQVHHYGDTRGNDWCSEVTGYNRQYALGLLDGLFAGTSGGLQ